MAKKKTIIEETVPDTPLLQPEPELTGKPWVKVKVYKHIPGRTQAVFCFAQQANIDDEGLQNSSYGGGRYEVRYMDVEDNVLHTTEYEVADRPQPSQPSTPETIQIQMLREQSQMNRDLLMAVLGTGQRASTPMSELATMWSVMSGHAPGNNGGDKTLVDIFVKGLELGAGKAGDMDWKTALIQTARDVLPSIAQAAAVIKGGPAMTPEQIAQLQQNAAAASGATAGNGGGTPTPAATAIPDLDTYAKVGLAYMKPRIVGGMPPDLALEWIVTNASDPQYKPFIDYALSKTFDDLVKLDPEVGNPPYKAWLIFVMDGIRQHFEELAKENSSDT